MTSRPDQAYRQGATRVHLRRVAEDCASGALPPNVALLRLAIGAVHAEEVETLLAEACRRLEGEQARLGRERLRAAIRLWRENPQAFAVVKAVLEDVEHGGAAPDPEQGIAYWTASFDRMARASPEGSVALYALGNPDLLRAATADVVSRLDDWGLLRPEARVLEIGCGIGRFVAALSPHVAHVTGLDLSPVMIGRARERCAGLANVALAVSSGRDLAAVPDASQDLVLAADVFPYLVQAGAEVVERHFGESARVLRAGGRLLILNFSYRGDLGRDGNDVRDLAERHRMDVLRATSGDFAYWDAATFLLGRAEPHAGAPDGGAPPSGIATCHAGT